MPSSGVWTPTSATGGLAGGSTTYSGSPGGATGGDGQNPTASNLVNQPYSSWIDPTVSPATWSYSSQDENQYAKVYTGSSDEKHVSQLSTNVLVGNIAQKLGLKPQKGVSKEEQVVSVLMQKWNLGTAAGAKSNSQEMESQLGALLGYASGQNLAPGKSMASVVKVKSLDDPNAWTAIAKAVGVSPSDTTDSTKVTMTPWQKVAQSYITTLQQQGSGAISQLQAQLYAGNYYDQPEMTDPTKIKEGNLDPYTIKALGEAIKATAAANKAGQNVTVQQFLAGGASQVGVSPGTTLSGVAGTGSAVTAKSVIQDTQGQLAPSLRSAFEADLGFAPSAAQLAQFTQQYQGLQQAHATSANPDGITFVDPNNIPEIPGIASPTAAAGNFAVNNDTTAYLAHGMANAAALIQNAIGSSGDRPLNSDPNLTSAARPI